MASFHKEFNSKSMGDWVYNVMTYMYLLEFISDGNRN